MILTHEVRVHILLFVFSKRLRGGTIENDDGGRFYDYINELLCGRLTSQFSAAPFVFSFVILSSLAAQLASIRVIARKGAMPSPIL